MITVETLGSLPLFAGLPPERLAHVADHAADLLVERGEYVAHEGELPAFFVVLEGRLEITKRVGGVERVIGSRKAGDYIGRGAAHAGLGHLRQLPRRRAARA